MTQLAPRLILSMNIDWNYISCTKFFIFNHKNMRCALDPKLNLTDFSVKNHDNFHEFLMLKREGSNKLCLCEESLIEEVYPERCLLGSFHKSNSKSCSKISFVGEELVNQWSNFRFWRNILTKIDVEFRLCSNFSSFFQFFSHGICQLKKFSIKLESDVCVCKLISKVV